MADARFPPRARLRHPPEFERVLKTGRRLNDACFAVLILPNELAEARLGLVIAKRHVRDAHARNRIKRVTRESFRRIRHQLPALDCVVMARNAATAEKDNAELRGSLDHFWKRLSA